MENKGNVLLVEAYPPTITDRRALAMAGYQVREAGSIQKAKQALAAHRIDLILLDVLLPDGSGLDFCRNLRLSSTVPILFLTDRAEPRQKVEGLRAGGDDYLAKPYHLEELLARIDALLRRSSMNSPASTQAHARRVYGSLRLDSASCQAYLSGRKIPLAPREFLLMWYLAEHHGQVNSPEDLYWHVWGELPMNAAATLRVYINSLRRKLQLAEEPSLSLENEYGKGYRLVVRDN